MLKGGKTAPHFVGLIQIVMSGLGIMEVLLCIHIIAEHHLQVDTLEKI